MSDKSSPNLQEISRDFVTVQTALYNIFPKVYASIQTKSPKRSRDLENFKDEIFAHIAQFRCKFCDKDKIFVPGATRPSFDGNILFRQVDMSLHFIIPLINMGNQTKLAWADCYTITTDRGLCLLCLVQNFAGVNKNCKPNFLTADGFVIIKDHAIRRVIERSPIKNYESAAGFILWSVLKNNVSTTEPIEIFSDAETMKNATASYVEYSHHGRTVGTRFREKSGNVRTNVVLINTYLGEN
jgi:hypothetical protein